MKILLTAVLMAASFSAPAFSQEQDQVNPSVALLQGLFGTTPQHGGAVPQVPPPGHYDHGDFSDLGRIASDSADRISRFERSLSEGDRRELMDLFRRVDRILDYYGPGGSGGQSLLCKPYYRSFLVYDALRGKDIGGEVNLDTCSRIVSTSRNDLVCKPYYRSFLVYDLAKGRDVGGETTLDTCTRVVESSSRNFVCKPYYRSFILFDRVRGSNIGGEVTLETCLRLTGQR